jgi:hypothetical protein
MILFILLATTTSARSSEIFKDHLTNLIWEDCRGKDIHINQPNVIINTATNNSITLFKGQAYTKDDLRRIVEILDNYTYRDYLGPCDSRNGTHVSGIGFVDGCGVLSCENYILNIDKDGYEWKGIRVDVPKEELFAIASGDNNTQVINKGDGSPINIGNNNIANAGDNSSITKQDLNISFAKGTIFGLLVSILLKFLYDLFGKKYLKRLFKKK